MLKVYCTDLASTMGPTRSRHSAAKAEVSKSRLSLATKYTWTLARWPPLLWFPEPPGPMLAPREPIWAKSPRLIGAPPCSSTNACAASSTRRWTLLVSATLAP